MKTRFENGVTVPAVDVKVRHHIALPAPVAKAMADRDDYDDITEAASEDVRREWWETELPSIADKCFKSAFKGHHYDTSSAGRSSGWAVVYGLGDPEEWTVRQHAAWTRFEKAVKKSLKQAEKFYIAGVQDRVFGGL